MSEFNQIPSDEALNEIAERHAKDIMRVVEGGLGVRNIAVIIKCAIREDRIQRMLYRPQIVRTEGKGKE